MDVTINYGTGAPLKNTITIPTLTTSEQDLFIVKDSANLKYSQLAIYGAVTLGTSASATFNYYGSIDGGTTWYPISLYATSTGVITQRSVVVNSTTYALTGVSYFLDFVPLPGTTAFKVTGLCASGSATIASNGITIIARNN